MLTKKQKNELYACLAPKKPSYFRKYGTSLSANGELIHIDRGSNILGVAHLDYVDYKPPTFNADCSQVFCPQLDDRLGAWVLLYLIPSMGVNIEVLLTDNEEIGQTTAQDFQPSKDYNWVVEFDRMGTDAVLYQYENDTSRTVLSDAGYEIGIGSFSDISELEHLGVMAMNLAVGYYRQHTPDCYANLEETLSSVAKFKTIYDKYQNIKLAWEPTPESKYTYDVWGDGWENDHDSNIFCVTCNDILWTRNDDVFNSYCPNCDRRLIQELVG